MMVVAGWLVGGGRHGFDFSQKATKNYNPINELSTKRKEEQPEVVEFSLTQFPAPSTNCLNELSPRKSRRHAGLRFLAESWFE